MKISSRHVLKPHCSTQVPIGIIATVQIEWNATKALLPNFADISDDWCFHQANAQPKQTDSNEYMHDSSWIMQQKPADQMRNVHEKHRILAAQRFRYHSRAHTSDHGIHVQSAAWKQNGANWNFFVHFYGAGASYQAKMLHPLLFGSFRSDLCLARLGQESKWWEMLSIRPSPRVRNSWPRLQLPKMCNRKTFLIGLSMSRSSESQTCAKIARKRRFFGEVSSILVRLLKQNPTAEYGSIDSMTKSTLNCLSLRCTNKMMASMW